MDRGKRKHNSVREMYRETVKLDFDKTTFKTVKYWALKTCRWFRLNGLIILKLSKKRALLLKF